MSRMLNELSRTIALTQQFLSEFAAPPSQRASAGPSTLSARTYALLASISDKGIARINHPHVADALATQLHQATETHFKRACMSLHAAHAESDLPTLQSLALDLRETYTSIYKAKVIETARRPRQSLHFTEKQPFATDILIYAFDQSPTPTKRERAALASLTGLTLEQVRVWFQNRRQRMKKRAPELQAPLALQLEDVLVRVAAWKSRAENQEDEFEDNDSGYNTGSDLETRARHSWDLPKAPTNLTVPSTTPRSWPAPYTRQEPTAEFRCGAPVFQRTAATQAPVLEQGVSTAELARLMSRLTLRHRRQTPRSSTGSSASAVSVAATTKSTVKSKKAVLNATSPNGDGNTRKKATRKDAETGRKVAGRRAASTAVAASPASSSSALSPPTANTSSDTVDAPAVPRKRLGPLRRKPAGKALARQASESSVGSTSSSDSSRSTSYSSDFSLASDSSFTSVESAPTAATMECFQPQQPLQFDPLAAFDFTQLFSSQPSDPLPQPVADFELPPDLLAGLQMPMDTAALPPSESTDFLALLNDPTIQDLLQSVQDMDVVAPQQMQESSTFNNTLDFGSVDTSAFLDLSASTLPTFDAMFGLDASSFQDTLWNSPGFSLPITA